jgi:hypothetical protein
VPGPTIADRWASSRTTIPLLLAFAAALVLPDPIFFHTMDEIDDDDATAASLSFSAGSIESFLHFI